MCAKSHPVLDSPVLELGSGQNLTQFTREDVRAIHCSVNSTVLSMICAVSKTGCRIHYYPVARGMRPHCDYDNGKSLEAIRYSLCYNLEEQVGASCRSPAHRNARWSSSSRSPALGTCSAQLRGIWSNR